MDLEKTEPLWRRVTRGASGATALVSTGALAETAVEIAGTGDLAGEPPWVPIVIFILSTIVRIIAREVKR